MNQKEFLKQIKPKIKGESDKYSWQLYEFLRKNYNRFGIPNVYYIQTQDSWDSKEEKAIYVDRPFDENDSRLNYIWIGDNHRDGWYYGNKLSNILGCSREKYTVFACPYFNNRIIINITEWFWNEYLKIGRCIWDRSHHGWLVNDDKRFIYVNKNSRKCQWCGLWQHREIEKRVKIERKEVWKDDTSNM
jgi:hypothetical protein